MRFSEQAVHVIQLNEYSYITRYLRIIEYDLSITLLNGHLMQPMINGKQFLTTMSVFICIVWIKIIFIFYWKCTFLIILLKYIYVGPDIDWMF